MPAPIVVYSPDLLLRQKLVAGIEGIGRVAAGAASATRLRSRLADGAGALIIEMDADGVEPLSLLASLRADPATAELPIAGFCAHTRDDLIAEARAAGATMVVSRGAIVRKLPAIIEELVGAPAGDDPPAAA